MKKINCLSAICVLGLLHFLPSYAASVEFSNSSNDKQLASDILVYVNQYRVQHGLSKLILSRDLTLEARQHSFDMATHAQPFGHGGFNDRIKHLYNKIPEATSGAENVAYNYKTAKIVVDGWIKSPGHRQNLMGHYDLTGIGIARDKTGKIYYTQMFLRVNHRLASRVYNHLKHRTV